MIESLSASLNVCIEKYCLVAKILTLMTTSLIRVPPSPLCLPAPSFLAQLQFFTVHRLNINKEKLILIEFIICIEMFNLNYRVGIYSDFFLQTIY